MTKLILAVVLVLGVSAAGCGKSKPKIGKEICPLVAAKIQTCKEQFWPKMSQGGMQRDINEGKEREMCEAQFDIKEAQGDVLDGCKTIDDCAKWTECAVPGFFGAYDKANK